MVGANEIISTALLKGSPRQTAPRSQLGISQAKLTKGALQTLLANELNYRLPRREEFQMNAS